jgi:hypothetical protein
MQGRLILLLVVGMLFPGATATAHHSFTATYDENVSVEIEGRIVQFMFRNPHAWVHVMAPDENGEIQRWGVEWGGTRQLGAQGVQRDTLRAGDVVIISGPPGRNKDEHRMLMRTLFRPSDEFGWGERPSERFD